MLRRGLSKILNVDLNDSQWTQATLPVHMDGLGVRSACMLAPSAFLTSAAAMLSLQQAILPEPLRRIDDFAVSYTLSMRKTQTSKAEPSDATKHIQRAWDNLVVTSTFTDLLSACTIPVEKARLKAVTALHAGNWLKVSSIAAVGLRLSDEEIRVAVGLRLGATICQQHACICGSPVDAWGLHGLSCRKS